MARRPDPARILAAQREGTRQRLIGTGILPERVETCCIARPTAANVRASLRSRNSPNGRPCERQHHARHALARAPGLQEAAAAALDSVFAEPTIAEAR
jgi:hypothetical protein